MILKGPFVGWKRPAIPGSVKVKALVARYGEAWLVPVVRNHLLDTHGTYCFHHDPGLWERDFDTEARKGKGDTIPPCNAFQDKEGRQLIFALTRREHDIIENGPGGEKRITSAGSASNQRAKTKRLAKQLEGRERSSDRPKRKLRGRSFWPKTRKIPKHTNPWGKR